MIGKIANLFKPVTNLVDELVTTKEERDKIKLKIEEVKSSLEPELTKRHQNDMLSDSWLSKNIRPLALAFLLFITTVLAFIDGNIEGFNIKPSYIAMFGSHTDSIVRFYVGFRGVEKCVSFFKKRADSK